MKLTPGVIRFLLEAAFIVAVAAATAVAHLDKLWIALAVGGAWVLVALVERTAKQDQTPLLTGPLGFLFPGHRPAAPAQDHPPEHVNSQPPQQEHPEPEPPPLPEPPAPEPAPPAPDPEPPRPEPGQPTPQLRSVPAPPPEPEPAPEAQPHVQETQVLPFRPRGGSREWNVWDLERIAREREGEDATRDEELAFLLLELRQFANADGQLPGSFDAVVREAFGESLLSAV